MSEYSLAIPISVSEIKLFISNQLAWYYTYVKKRIPIRFELALEVGQFWHTLMEAFYTQGRSKQAASVAAMEWLSKHPASDDHHPKSREFIAECTTLLHLFESNWTDPCPEAETLSVETPIAMALGEYTLIGKPDRVIKYVDKWWHMQHRSLSGRTNLDLYFETAQNDLHELVYSWLCQHHFGISFEQWGGTLFNVIRKPSTKSYDAESMIVRAFIPITKPNIYRALGEIEQVLKDMEDIRSGIRVPIQNRELDRGRFGNSRSPYFPVTMGTASLDDPLLFTDTIDRYADIPDGD